MKLRARHAQLEPMLADSIAKDLDAGPDDIRPLLIAASMTAALTSVRDRLEAESPAPRSPTSRAGDPRPGARVPARRARPPAVPGLPELGALRRVPQPLRLGQRLELLQRVVLDLADPLAGDVERATDLLERVRAARRSARTASRSPRARARAERPARAAGSRGAGARRPARTATRRSGPRRSRRAPIPPPRRSASPARSAAGPSAARRAPRARSSRAPVGDLLGRRLAAQLLDELALDVNDLVELLDHVDGNPDRPALVGDRAGDRLADPPGRVRRELVAAAVVELLDRADQPHRPLLDQIQEREPAAEVRLRDRDHQPQVGLDHLLLGEPCRRARSAAPARPPARRSADSTRPIDRRYSRSESERRLDRQVDLDLLASPRCSGRGRLARRRPPRSTLPPSDLAIRPSASTTSIP